MSSKQTSKNAGQTPLHSLFDYQKEKTNLLLKWLTIISVSFCGLGGGLGLLWYFNSSWLAIIFAVIFGIIGLGLSVVTFIVSEKVEIINTLGSGALNIYDMAQKKNTIIDVENEEPKQPDTVVEVKEIQVQPSENLHEPQSFDNRN